MSITITLPDVFKDESWNTATDKNYVVTLAPEIADYKCRLDYDEAGNANVTIIRKRDDVRMLDMCLDTGEINEINGDFLSK